METDLKTQNSKYPNSLSEPYFSTWFFLSFYGFPQVFFSFPEFLSEFSGSFYSFPSLNQVFRVGFETFLGTNLPKLTSVRFGIEPMIRTAAIELEANFKTWGKPESKPSLIANM